MNFPSGEATTPWGPSISNGIIPTLSTRSTVAPRSPNWMSATSSVDSLVTHASYSTVAEADAVAEDEDEDEEEAGAGDCGEALTDPSGDATVPAAEEEGVPAHPK